MVTMRYRGYTANITRDEESGVYHGEVEKIGDVITFQADLYASSIDAVFESFRKSVDDYLEFCEERGEEPEQPQETKDGEIT